MATNNLETEAPHHTFDVRNFPFRVVLSFGPSDPLSARLKIGDMNHLVFNIGTASWVKKGQ